MRYIQKIQGRGDSNTTLDGQKLLVPLDVELLKQEAAFAKLNNAKFIESLAHWSRLTKIEKGDVLRNLQDALNLPEKDFKLSIPEISRGEGVIPDPEDPKQKQLGPTVRPVTLSIQTLRNGRPNGVEVPAVILVQVDRSGFVTPFDQNPQISVRGTKIEFLLEPPELRNVISLCSQLKGKRELIDRGFLKDERRFYLAGVESDLNLGKGGSLSLFVADKNKLQEFRVVSFQCIQEKQKLPGIRSSGTYKMSFKDERGSTIRLELAFSRPGHR